MAGSRALETYLKDHLAGSAGGAALARRLASGSDHEAERREMSSIADDIEADRQSLLALMDSLEVSPSRFKQAGARVGQVLSAVKLNASGPDRRVLQYEAMIMGVTGKLELWRSLETVAGSEPGLKLDEIRALAGRAEDQRKRLEALHSGTASTLAPG